MPLMSITWKHEMLDHNIFMENATSAFSQTPSTPRGGIIIPSTSVYTRLYAQIEERNLYIVQQGVRKASISQSIFNLVLFFFFKRPNTPGVGDREG